MSDRKIQHNVYFEGNVQSLGLDTERGKATVGVMKPGSYIFSASVPETMLVIAGTLSVKNGDTFTSYGPQEQFEVSAGASFEVVCESDAAYICYYG
ncbi:pyrimidine/purine nucleoside phosphorylase [Pedobacter sp. JY14-1]|uniref:pyrimidine/purine nucleoside phosphorylase n=1 Tax=Pedobacter sp. JY14-1 TaxID=3034151 RepID=UPI0023E0E8BF|nr:pyrimidine/purine nucleoside phosphorylase [Pedobacter sp. JY14-1]